MAYAFSKLDDYFRRGKTGTSGGNLEKGATGAPPPTVQAQNLAKSAETSSEQGNAGAASAYRAAKTADTSGIQTRLSQPTEQQAKNWTDQAERGAGEYRTAGDTAIGQTYQAYDPKNLAGAEKGESGATANLQQQTGYTGKELTFQPFQVEAPKLDTSSMLAGGVGGIQAALQQKGGRYTPGMAALDASVLAGNKQALSGLQQKLGGIQQGAREKKTALEGTDEEMATKAQTRADEIRNATKTAIQSRLGALRDVQGTQFAEQRGTPQTAEAQRQALLQNFPAQLDYWANFSGITPEQLQAKGLGISPESLMTSSMQNVNVGPSAAQTNLSNILGLAAPEAMTGQKQVWSMQDPGALYRQNVGLYQQKVEAEQAAAARAAQLAAQQQAAAEAEAAKRQNTDLYGGGEREDGSVSDYGYDSGSESSSSSYGDGGTVNWAGNNTDDADWSGGYQ
jgi:hypothetical protein